MKKYLPFLGIFLLLPLLFLQNNKLEVFETTLSEIGDKYFDELGGVIPSDKLFYIPAFKAEKKEFRVEQSANDPDGINYKHYTAFQVGEGSLDFDCSKYENIYGVRCNYMRYVAGENYSTVIENLKGVKIDDFMSLFLYLGYLSDIAYTETGTEYGVTDTCKEYSDFSITHTPLTICDKYFDSRLRSLCTSDTTSLLSIAKLQVSNADDFFCYYRAYDSLKIAGV